MGRLVHFEILANNPEEAVKFRLVMHNSVS